MSLTRSQVEGIAHLARLDVTEAELPAYVDSLSKILSFVEQLSAADTAAVSPMAHPLEGESQRLRADEVTESDRHERFQVNAPSVTDALYIVPRVIE
jgi:aspartyl-tRNA(Asn)/glutamyl-tRNA(Gln) amidotransferase subunit C